MPDKTSFAEWVRDHAIVADSLDPQAPLDDLQPLRALIGDARVVAIGKSAHYVREFYLLRHRLLRFLAERCGFTIYALEAPFTEAYAIDAWDGGLFHGCRGLRRLRCDCVHSPDQLHGAGTVTPQIGRIAALGGSSKFGVSVRR